MPNNSPSSHELFECGSMGRCHPKQRSVGKQRFVLAFVIARKAVKNIMFCPETNKKKLLKKYSSRH